MKDWQFLKEVGRMQGQGRWGRLGLKGNRRRRAGLGVGREKDPNQKAPQSTGKGLWKEKDN